MISDPGSALNSVSAVDHVMRGRFANRFFVDRPVGLATITEIIEVARHAGTGANVQPWRVHVVTGHAKGTLTRAIGVAHETAPGAHLAEYNYFPENLPEPYASRRREFGAVDRKSVV